MPFYVFCLITTWHQIEYFDIYVFNNIWKIQFSIWITDIITTSTAFIYFNTKRIKYSLIIVDIYYFVLVLHSWLFIETHSKEFAFNILKLKKVIAVKNTFFTNLNILFYATVFH